MNISTAGTTELIRRVKARGVKVTAEICAPHFTWNDECLRTFDSNYKLNPPLRSQDHVDACIAALADGTIDVIASGHAPRASEKKMQELDQAPFGMVNLETTLSLVVTRLIQPGYLDWPAPRQTHHQPGPRPGARQGDVADRRRRGCDHHRSRRAVDREPRPLSFQEHQHAAGRDGVAGTSRLRIVGGKIKLRPGG